MKRWIAGFISLVLVLAGAAAPAEEAAVVEISWDLYEAAVEEAGIEGDYVALDETGIVFWLPDFMMFQVEEEETAETEAPADGGAEEDEGGAFTAFVAVDGSAFIDVELFELEDGFTLDEMGEILAEDGETVFRVRVNGMDGFYLEDSTVAYLVLVFEPGKAVRFAFCPIDDEEYQEVFKVILASIRKETAE